LNQSITIDESAEAALVAAARKELAYLEQFGVNILPENDYPQGGSDFAAAVQEITGQELHKFFVRLLAAEVAASKRLEEIAFGSLRPRLYRNEVQIDQM